MKIFLTKFLTISSLGLLMLVSCKKEGVKVIATSGTAGTLTSNVTTLPLDKSKVNDTSKVITFKFTQANFGFKAAITNTLQIDVASDNWANPTTATLSANVLTQGYSTSDFNSLVLKLNLPAGVSSTVLVRVMQSIGSNVAPTYSNVLSLSVTPFNLVSYVYVPGAYQGWTPATADSLQSPTDNGVYTGVINFANASDYTFKVTSDKKGTLWYGNLGGVVSSSGSAGNFSFVDKATVDPAVNIKSDQIVLDLNKNTITLTPTLWSVVGDASPGGWPNPSGYQSDTDMKFNNTTQTWSVVVNLTPGGIKFRLNHDWGVNYGSVTSPGQLDTANNNNIAITTAGTYLITVDIAHLTYTLTKQ